MSAVEPLKTPAPGVSPLERATELIDEAGQLLRERRPYVEAATMLAESAPFATWALDRDGRVLWCNPEFEAVTHQSLHEIKGKQFTQCLGPGLDALYEQDEAVMATGRSRRYVGLLLSESSPRTVLKWPLFAEDGAIIGVCGAMS